MSDKNQILITLDSLRWDVFELANLPFLKSFPYSKAHTHGTYTLPAHQSFLVIGKLPSSSNGDQFDTCARSMRKTSKQQWRLSNPESVAPNEILLSGRNLVDGFNRKGYNTIGTGAVSWFDDGRDGHLNVVDDFKNYKFFGEYVYAKEQTNYVLDQISKTADKYFAFLNLGETHHTFRISENDKPTSYSNKAVCMKAQIRCIEYLDGVIKKFVDSIDNVEIIICADHGECFGEDGFWGHSFFHEKVMEVPILKIVK
jgi:hypothetical protein